MHLRRFLTAEWRDLLLLNYEVDPTLLGPLIPLGTELDDHEGHTYVSLVAFRFIDTRVLQLAVPLHRNFEELNLRFYVRREVGGELRRGEVFVREVVPRRVIATMARVLYNEPYIALPMRSQVDGVPPVVRYAWAAGGKWHSLEARGNGAGLVPPAGSHEAFIAEHYWGYTRRRDGATSEYRVEHPRWHVWPATELRMEADFSALYGPTFGAALVQPKTAFIAAGSAVAVHLPQRLDVGRAAA